MRFKSLNPPSVVSSVLGGSLADVVNGGGSQQVPLLNSADAFNRGLRNWMRVSVSLKCWFS